VSGIRNRLGGIGVEVAQGGGRNRLERIHHGRRRAKWAQELGTVALVAEVGGLDDRRRLAAERLGIISSGGR
jgi:hypothetical protein